MSNPKITIIIPTRERAEVLRYSLQTVMMQDYQNLEIIVCDNFSNDETEEIVKGANDARIRYINTGKRLSMSHNWEFALSHVTDGWVTFIGDDDGLLPGGIIKIVKIIQETNAYAIRTESCTYDWPGMPDYPNGQLVVPLTSGFEVRNSQAYLKKVLEGKEKYNQLPMIYNGGFIHIQLMNKIKDKVGSFFSSVNPDVYTAMALARLTENYIYVKEPISISGTSKYSNGYSAFSTNTQRNLEHYKKFLSEENIPLHKDIPPLRDGTIPLSLQACAYEAYLQSELVGGKILTMEHEKQLHILLATSEEHQDLINDWCSLFAEQHDLDYKQAYKKSIILRRKYQIRVFIRKLTRVLNSVVISHSSIRNIYEASIAAAIIIASPSRVDSAKYLFNKLFSKMNKINN
ncbi:glycosyltransferase family 2 protein [Acinetobacter brisouii]|uniref:glycosyltransferase family 2 protein n=1 Tax=Acinetobacter brisouii TaxID=396323 RepID=UPI0035B1FF93